MNERVTVPVKSAFESKINWVQVIGFIAILGSFFGFDLDANTQAAMATAIGAITQVITWVLRTFFSKSVIASSVGN